MHSGLRSARDKILLYFEEAFARQSMTRGRLFKVVNLYAQQVRRVSVEDGEALRAGELRFNAFSLIGGQMSDDSTHKLYLVYPEGNWVEIGSDTPYQIIGASGFGKPILERSLNHTDSMLYAFKVGLLAFDATRLCAADVDFPMRNPTRKPAIWAGVDSPLRILCIAASASAEERLCLSATRSR